MTRPPLRLVELGELAPTTGPNLDRLLNVLSVLAGALAAVEAGGRWLYRR